MRVGVDEDVVLCSVVAEYFENLAYGATLGAACEELAIGECAGAALAESVVGLGVQGEVAVKLCEVFLAFGYVFASFEDDGA